MTAKPVDAVSALRGLMIGLILAGFGFTFMTWSRMDALLERLVRVEVKIEMLTEHEAHEARQGVRRR